jgi:hypothetical protein
MWLSSMSDHAHTSAAISGGRRRSSCPTRLQAGSRLPGAVLLCADSPPVGGVASLPTAPPRCAPGSAGRLTKCRTCGTLAYLICFEAKLTHRRCPQGVAHDWSGLSRWWGDTFNLLSGLGVTLGPRPRRGPKLTTTPLPGDGLLPNQGVARTLLSPQEHRRPPRGPSMGAPRSPQTTGPSGNPRAQTHTATRVCPGNTDPISPLAR